MTLSSAAFAAATGGSAKPNIKAAGMSVITFSS